MSGELKCAAHPSSPPAERPESQSQTWPAITPKGQCILPPHKGSNLGARHQRGRLPFLAWHLGAGRTTASFTARLRPVGRHQSPPLPGLSACAAKTQLSPGLVSVRVRGAGIWAASAWGVRTDQRVLVSGGAEWGARAGPGFGVETQAARSVAEGWRGEE